MEMETTPDQKDRIRTIIQKLMADDKNWFNQQEIAVGNKGPYWVLNYMQGSRNEYNQLVRGMIIRKPNGQTINDPLDLIVSFPFMRFYNKGEKEAAPVDFSKADMLEKLDGSMVGVFFPDGDPSKPQYHTRKMVSAHKPDMDMMIGGFETAKSGPQPFMKIIGEYVNKLHFTKEDVAMTYVFEFIHEISKVLTSYSPEKYGLHLLGARNIRTHRELTEDQLDVIARRIGAPRPRRWNTTGDEAEIRQMMDEIGKDTENFEGAVFRDPEGNRVKLKRDDYVKLHHLLDKLSFKHLIPKVLEGESEEITAYFPSAKKTIETFQKAFDDYIDKAVVAVRKYHDQKLDRKTLAMKIFHGTGEDLDQYMRSLVMKHYENGDEDSVRQIITRDLKTVALGRNGVGGSPQRLMEIIGIHDDESDEKQDKEP